MSKRLALMVAVIMGLLAVVLIHIYITNMRHSVYSGMDMVRVLVAAEDLQKGDVLTDAKVAYRQYPVKYVGDRAIEPVASAAAMGSQVKDAIGKGYPVFWSDIVTRIEVDAGLAGDLQPNMCAITIPVTQISGLAGLLTPGMRVNVLLTTDTGCLRKPAGEDQLSPERAAAMATTDIEELKASLAAPPRPPSASGESKGKVNVMLFQDVLVLAVGGQRIGAPAPPRTAGEQAMYNTVTLMLTPREGQVLTLAMTQGQINLMLRRAGETGRLPAPVVVSCGDMYDFIMGD